ncbi:MAG: hypothetical protein DWQ49_04520 [Bacteroidetes bacterium]|nr:MAG: hypothetical protein DWQ49_04520 [Bacteroidota bacterium]
MSDLENQVTEADLHDEDVVEEAHDPKNAEAQSVGSVKAAGNAGGGKAPEPAPKQGTHEPMPKTKAGMLQAMYGKMAKMNKAQLTAAYGKMHEDAEVEEEAMMESPEVAYDYAGELDALVESEATLSEEFKEKTTVIFEAAMKSKLAESISELEENYAKELAEEVATTKADLVEKVDGYLNYVVEQWMEDNKLAVQTGLRTEIAETFMNKLKDVFTESYIEVPESKIDLVDELSEQVEELEEALNARTEEALEQAKTIEEMTRAAVIEAASKDLADTQAEKLAGLVEGIDFDDEETFAKKVAVVKEAHFAAPAVESTIAEETDEDAPTAEEISETMATYLSAIRKQNK